MKILVLLVILVASLSAAAQSGRVGPSTAASPAVGSGQSVKQLFDEANGYSKAKFSEYEQKKVPYSESLMDRTRLEQRQLAAKYATLAGSRENLAGDDFYYLGMLHWVAENLDGTLE